MKYLLVLFVSSAALVAGFVPSHHHQQPVAFAAKKTELYSKKNPQGAPITIQEDEDAAMWIDDGAGKRKQAIKGPIGGRPINKVTKQQIQGDDSKKKPSWWPF